MTDDLSAKSTFSYQKSLVKLRLLQKQNVSDERKWKEILYNLFIINFHRKQGFVVKKKIWSKCIIFTSKIKIANSGAKHE